MIIKLKEFKEVADKILLAAGLDENAANVELRAKDHTLFLAITNREYYCCIKFPIESDETFRAVVDASLFLNLIAGLTTETFELEIKENAVVITAGKSNYKLSMIYENNQLMTVPIIAIKNKTVEMPISNDILMSILNVNSKEILKTKWLVDVSELQKLYYIDETGCFTFTVGACMNSFSLDKPVKILLNDRIVKLFKLFKTDVNFTLGYDELAEGIYETKVTFETDNIYVAAKINCEDALLNKIKGPYEATKRFLADAYSYAAVVSVPALSAAISRLLLFTKNSIDKVNMALVPAKVKITPDEIIMTDKFENCEVVAVENGSSISDTYEFGINLTDIKLILDSCKVDHITLNYGNHKFVNFVRGNISNLIPETKKSNG